MPPTTSTTPVDHAELLVKNLGKSIALAEKAADSAGQLGDDFRDDERAIRLAAVGLKRRVLDIQEGMLGVSDDATE